MKWFENAHPSYPKGAEICRHPFLDSESFYGVSRRSPAFSSLDRTPIENSFPEKNCAFCAGRLREATPDKSRTLLAGDSVLRVPYPKLEENENILFRRQGNLFEIISFEYWHQRYGLDSTPEELEIIHSFFAEKETHSFLTELLHIKYLRTHMVLPEGSLIQAAKPFFSGYHELLTSGRHYLPKARHKGHLCSSGNMHWSEHRISYEEIILIHQDMTARNPHIEYISTFQNWLSLAGASFEHWHKQILAADFWGKPLMRERDCYQENPHTYKEFALYTALQHNLILAENEHALALLEVGSKSGLISVVSKSQKLLPQDHSIEEIHAMSDLVHAVCACIGPSTPYNEEWFYTPFNAQNFRTPWRVLINLRTGIEAGFENINQYLVSTVSQRELADTLRLAIAILPTKAPGVTAVSARPSHKKSLQYL